MPSPPFLPRPGVPRGRDTPRLFALMILASPVWVQGAEDPAPRPGETHPPDPSYRLVWQDEFSGPRLDRKKWRAVDDPTIGRYGHGNGESQAYLDAEGETFLVRDGRLTIVAHHAPDATYPLRDKPSGKIRKKIGHQDFKSAKLTLCGPMILPRGERAGIQLGPGVVATGRV